MFANIITPPTDKSEFLLVLLVGKLRHGTIKANRFKFHSESFSKPMKGKEEML